MFGISEIRVVLGVVALSYTMLAFSATETIMVDGIGSLEYSRDESGLAITFLDSGTHKRMSYHQQNFDECSAMAMYRVPGTSQIAIDGSCASRGGEVFIHVYQWNEHIRDWCLIRQITGEKPDIPSGDLAGSMEVSRVLGCPKIGDDESYTYESVENVQIDINKELARLKIAEKDKAQLDNYLMQIPFYFPVEIASYVGKVDIQMANDLAFFLTQKGRANDAIPLLEKIVSLYPNRVVAKLNLADALWENSLQDQAKMQYAAYVSQMKKEGKQDLVPERATQREGK
jgi:hypothetical protein